MEIVSKRQNFDLETGKVHPTSQLPVLLPKQLWKLDLTEEEQLEIYNSYHWYVYSSKENISQVFLSDSGLSKLDYSKIPKPTVWKVILADIRFSMRHRYFPYSATIFFYYFMIITLPLLALALGPVGQILAIYAFAKGSPPFVLFPFLIFIAIEYCVYRCIMRNLREAVPVMQKMIEGLQEAKRLSRTSDDKEIFFRGLQSGFQKLEGTKLQRIQNGEMDEIYCIVLLNAFIHYTTKQYLCDGMIWIGVAGTRYAKSDDEHKNLKKLIYRKPSKKSEAFACGYCCCKLLLKTWKVVD